MITPKKPPSLPPLNRFVDDHSEEDDLHDYQLKCLHDTAWCRTLMARLYDEHKVEEHFPRLSRPELTEEELRSIKDHCQQHDHEQNVKACVEKGTESEIRRKTINLMVNWARQEGRNSGRVNSAAEWAVLAIGGLLTIGLVGLIVVFFCRGGGGGGGGGGFSSAYDGSFKEGRSGRGGGNGGSKSTSKKSRKLPKTSNRSSKRRKAPKRSTAR